MSMLSVAIVIMSLVSPIFISTVQPFSERLGHTKAHLSKILHEIAVSGINSTVNQLKMRPSICTTCVASSSAAMPAPSEPDLVYPEFEHTNLMNCSACVPTFSELGAPWSGQSNQDPVSVSEYDDIGESFRYPDSGALLTNSQILSVTLIVLLMIPAITSVCTWYSRKQCLQVANIEILGFIQEVRTRKAFLTERLNSAVLTLNGHINGILRQVAMEHQRVCAELPTFLEEEIKELREALISQFQSEFDRHVLEVKDFAENLERVRRSLPDPGEIEAECRDFHSELQRWRQRMSESLAQISAETFLDGSFEGSTELGEARQSEELTTVQTDVAMSECQSGEEGEQKGMLEPCTENEGPTVENQEPISRMAQWAMASGYRAPTSAEFEEGQRIRHERVMRRQGAERGGQQSARNEPGAQKQRRPLKNWRHILHKQTQDTGHSTPKKPQ